MNGPCDAVVDVIFYPLMIAPGIEEPERGRTKPDSELLGTLVL